MAIKLNNHPRQDNEHDNDYQLFLQEIKRLEEKNRIKITKNHATTYKPFEQLNEILKQNQIEKIKPPTEVKVESNFQDTKEPTKSSTKLNNLKDDIDLFLKEIGEVRKLGGPEKLPNRPEKKFFKKEIESFFQLEIRDINDYSKIYHNAFSLEYSAEYVEWVASDVDKSLAKRLHRGEFSVQEYLDLHGYFLSDALEACSNFFTKALNDNKRCIAIIHGRGLSSTNGPVLKDAVIRWLKKGPYRRHILCFVTAPQNDGGFGVTYILLRKNRVR